MHVATEIPDERSHLPPKPLYAFIKRTLDIGVAFSGLVLLWPLLLLSAVLVKLGSAGPVLFKQVRVGRGFTPFEILKFRTMVVDAPRLGAQITAGEDPRITRVGRVLRKTKLDELPQLWNVLVGDMSLVGPRPEVPRYVEMFREDYRVILSVRPGITDPASIKYRDESALMAGCDDPERKYVEEILPDKLAINRRYLEQRSLGVDLGCVWRTVLAVLG